MADKDTQPKKVVKTTSAASKNEAKPAAPAAKQTAKPNAAAQKQPAAKPAAKPAPSATAKATAKPASAPAAKATEKPAVKPAVKSAAPSAEKPATKPAVKPAATAEKPVRTTAAAQKTAKAQPQEKTPVAAATVAADASDGKRDGASKARKDKPVKDKGAKENNSSGGFGAFIASFKQSKVRLIVASALAFVLVAAIILCIVLGAKSCKKDNDGLDGERFAYAYPSTTQVGFSSRVLGTTERKKPVAETKDENLPSGYPKYGYTLSGVLGDSAEQQAARAALIDESDYLTAYGTRNNSGNGSNGAGTYNMMDENGYLWFVNGGVKTQATYDDGTPRQLYKHTAAEGMYYGGINDANPDLSDDEPGIVKEVTIRPRGYGSYSVTGVYAPAGEVIKIEISEADMNATGGITIHIGQALYNGQSNNIWVAKGQMQRFPNILNTMVVNKDTATLENGVYTAYVGSFIGGPLYIRNTLASFTAKISGGVAYSHFILGYTTKEEFEENKKSTAPYFDLEVWNYGVLHSGPKFYAQKYSYEDIYKVAVLWEKVSLVTTSNSNQGIVFLYDPFVAAGAAVAFPGRSSVNCPAGWMDGSLNYNAIVTSGSWGNFHEYHHNFQNYGVGNGGEVTNNGMTLVSYALFTKISAKRGIESYGGQGLGGWNNYTSATWALNDILSLQRGGHPSNGDQGLALYATLLHNFGADNYIQAKVAQQRGGYGQSYAGYFRAWEQITHNDMTYYFRDVLKGLTTDVAQQWHNTEYTSMFVPVSSVYQTGRSYLYDGEKQYFQTMQPFVIPYGQEFNIDLGKYVATGGQYSSGSIVIPEGFSYRIKNITQPERGRIERIDDYKYKFTPDTNDKNNLFSGKITVTLEITKDDGAFKVDDVDLVLEFEQSHETNKMTLERTVYFYNEDNMYTDAKTAYENNFAGYKGEPVKRDHSNPTQNCNTDIWFVSSGFEDKFPNATQDHMIENNNNSVHVVKGKLYFEEDGKYRIYLRGRKNCAVYISYTDKNGAVQNKSAQVTSGSGAGFYPNNANTYIDIEIGKATFVDFTEVLIVKKADSSYIGLGYGKWTEPMFTMVEHYYDADGNEVSSPEAEGYHHTVTKYYNYLGVEVTAEEANNAQLIEPKGASYINAYRSDYEFPNNDSFESEYFYTREYTYSYNEAYSNVHGQFVGEHNCFYNESRTDFRPEYLLDGDKTTVALAKGQSYGDQDPWTFTVDLGKEISANRMTVTGYNTANQNQTPTWLELYVSKTGNADDFVLVYKNEKATVSGKTVFADFELQNFRYYKICAKNPANNARTPAIADIEFSFSVPNGKVLSPDSRDFTYAGNWHTETTASTFGHVYIGEKNAVLSFKFSGTRLALLSSTAYGKDFEVTIDGQKISSISLKEITESYGATFISDVLENKEHTVIIKCLGNANVDSVVTFP